MMATARPRRNARGSATPSDSVSRYMDTAEALFIRLGYEGTSIRAISAEAGMNLGTLTYHWGSKEALFRAVCERRFDAILAEQLRRLRLCEQAGKPGRADLEPVLRALIEPPLLMHRDDETAEVVRLLYGRVITDPSPVMARIGMALFAEAAGLFRKLLHQCLPELDAGTFYRRYACALGAFVFAQSYGHRVAEVARIDDLQADWDQVADEIVGFVKAGLERD